MKKVLVLFKSKTGFSERYARWIADDLQCDLANLAGFNKESLSEYDLVIYGAGIFAGQIRGIGKIKRWMEAFPEKTWVVFATGTTPSKEKYEELIFQSNFRKGESRPSHFYYFLSGINYEKMGFLNRILMKFFSGMSARKNGTTQSTSQTSIDLANRDYIKDILGYVHLKAR